MKVQIACFVLVSAIATISAPVQAADWGGGRESYKDVSVPAGIPVPAPVPILELGEEEWYVGFSGGAVLSTDADIENIGSVFPINEADDLDKGLLVGISFGRYITPSLRAEISLDYQRGVDIAGPAEITYSDTRTARGVDYDDGLGVVTPTFDTNEYEVTRRDVVELSRTTGLVNLIYDIQTGTRITPYVGAGIGFTWRQLQRSATEHAECVDTTNSNPIVDASYPVANCSITSDELPASYDTEGEEKSYRVDIAAALLAGFSYDVNEWIKWDNGYQLLWEGASISLDSPTVSGTSTVRLSDSMQHQFRTGLRFSVD